MPHEIDLLKELRDHLCNERARLIHEQALVELNLDAVELAIAKYNDKEEHR